MQVLVVCPDDYDRATLAQAAEHEFHFFGSEASHWHPDPDFNPVAYLERAIAYAREHRIQAVLSTHDLGSLIAAIVAREAGLPGPSAESVFLALHKFYGRRREAAPVRCDAVPLYAPTPQISYPAFLKAPWLKLGLLGYRLEGPRDLDLALENARREYPAWARQYYPLFERAVDVRNYPLATQDVVLIEEFIEGPQATVEGWMHHGQANIWAITDTNTCPGSSAIDNFSLPSRLPEDVQEAMKTHAAEAIRQIGFDEGFFNIELWNTARGIVTTEINGRAAVCFNDIYELALGRSIFPAVVELACGRDPGPPPQPGGRVAGQFNLTTFAEGAAADLMDYEAALGVAGLSILRPEDSQIRQTSQFGVVLAQLEISSETYAENHAQAEQVRRWILRQSPRPSAGAHAIRCAIETGAASASLADVPRLREISQRAATRLHAGAWGSTSVDEIKSELNGLRLAPSTLELLRATPSDDPWHELEVFDHPQAHASIFYLPQGGVIPLHDHPQMTVISKILQGRLRMRTLRWLDIQSGLALNDGEREFAAGDDAFMLAGGPGVLHEVVALTDCVFFDLFAPYYAEEEGRDCRYYQIESGSDGTVTLGRHDRAGVLTL